MNQSRSVFISGGGPTGLAAALLFDQLGWDEVIVAERRPSHDDFEKNKSFNYLVEARAQQFLDRLGIRDRLDAYGVATDRFVATTFAPDGGRKVRTYPLIAPGRPTCYWTTRRSLLSLLHEAIAERDSARIKLFYGHEVRGIRADTGQPAEIELVDTTGAVERFSPDLILACDGLNSAIRSAASALDQIPSGHFDMIAGDSISTGLRYKVLNLPAKFSLRNGDAVDDYRMTYVIPSRHSDRRKACALYAFPVVDPRHPRSVNLVREDDHVLWTIDTAPALLDFLEDSFPQIDIRALVSTQEAQDFVGLEAGKFPAPQYSRHVHASIGPESRPSELLLMGDAAHAFPPDLGLGVNAALQDLTVLAECLEAGASLQAAAADYARRREPESRDLAWVVQESFPEQYNHRPWRLRLWIVDFLVKQGLHAVAPRFFDKAPYYLSQEPEMSYSEMRHRIERTRRRVAMLGLALGSVLGVSALLARL